MWTCGGPPPDGVSSPAPHISFCDSSPSSCCGVASAASDEADASGAGSRWMRPRDALPWQRGQLPPQAQAEALRASGALSKVAASGRAAGRRRPVAAVAATRPGRATASCIGLPFRQRALGRVLQQRLLAREVRLRHRRLALRAGADGLVVAVAIQHRPRVLAVRSMEDLAVEVVLLEGVVAPVFLRAVEGFEHRA